MTRDEYLKIDNYYRDARAAIASADVALQALQGCDLPRNIRADVDRLESNIKGLLNIRKRLAVRMRTLSDYFNIGGRYAG